MKSFATLALAGLAAAQNITDRCGVSVNQDTSVLTPDVKPIADGLLQINSTTGALYDSIVAFDGSAASVQAVLTGAQTTLDTVTSVDNTVKGLTPITDANAFNALNLVQYVSDLACTVNFTVDAFIAQKAGVVAACQGPTALSQLNALLAGSTSLINDVVNVINDGDGFGLKGLAQTLSQPILDALNTGIAAFADQTSLPAGCAASSSTTTQTSTSTIVTGTTTVTTTATTTNTVTFGSGYGSSSLSKGPYGNSTASYGASKTTYGYPASSQPAKPTSYGASSISSYVKPSSSGAASYSAGVPAGSSPAASHPAASSSYAASSSHPAASSSAVKPSTTYPAGTVPYTGAASSIVAGGFSAVVAVFAAALML